MLHCLRPSSSTPTSNPHPFSPTLQAEGTSRSRNQLSPTINLTDEYNIAVQSSSYNEMWSLMHSSNSSYPSDTGQHDGHEEQQFLARFLHPNRECVQEVLQHVRPNTLIDLISAYFNHSETTSHLCHLLHNKVCCARSLYTPLYKLIDVLPLDFDSNSLVQSQCDQAYDIFLEFDRLDNPFLSPNPQFQDMQHCLSQHKKQLDYCLCKSHSRVRCLRYATTGSAICLIGTVVGVAISAVAIAAHALVAVVATPFLPALLPSKITKKELAHQALLDTAGLGTYVLFKHLQTIDCLVAGLHTTVEGDKSLIRLGLQMGRDRHPMQEVVKRLRNHPNFLHQLMDLEEHICLCYTKINRSRSRLLREIQLHQTHYS